MVTLCDKALYLFENKIHIAHTYALCKHFSYFKAVTFIVNKRLHLYVIEQADEAGWMDGWKLTITIPAKDDKIIASRSKRLGYWALPKLHVAPLWWRRM